MKTIGYYQNQLHVHNGLSPGSMLVAIFGFMPRYCATHHHQVLSSRS
jgi:hypothetical protein